MKRSKLLILAVLVPLLQLDAQKTDPELAERLKSVMALFDKNQQALKDEINQLKDSNTALTKANLGLFQDLQAAEKQIQILLAENETLKNQLRSLSVDTLVTASIQTTQVAAAQELEDSINGQVTRPEEPESATDTSPENPLINLNTASKEELMTLPLIDETMAERIISNRPYKQVEDLIINQEFGPMKLRRVTPFVTTN